MPYNGLSILDIAAWSGNTLPGGDPGSGIGRNAMVRVTGAPVTSISFKASRTPAYADAAGIDFVDSVVALIGGSVWFLTLPDVGGWYVWVIDGANACAESAAVWIGASVIQDLLEVGEKLRDTLLANEKLLNAAMAACPVYGTDGSSGAATLKQVQIISALGLTEFPSIAIDELKYVSEFAFLPWGKEFTYTCRLSFVIAHSDEQVAGNTAAQFMRAGVAILGQPAYETLVLPSGLVVNFGQCASGFVSESVYTEVGFVAVATASWSGKALKQGGDW